MTYGSLSDQQLTPLIMQGDEAAFAEVYNRYKGSLFLHAFRMLQNTEEAQDAVQDVFAALWKKRDAITINTALNSYLFGSIRNRVLDIISHQKVISKYTGSLETFLDKGERLTDDKIREKELIEIIEKEIAALPPKMREVFELSRNFNYSHKEIAEKLNLFHKTVKKQVANAIKILRLKINHFIILYLFL